jgi:dienelactone hydrolase
MNAPAASRVEVAVPAGPLRLPGTLDLPAGGGGLVVFAHGSGSSRLSPRNRFVADVLNEAGLATLLFDLLTTDEAKDRRNVFDIDLLAERVLGALEWAARYPATAGRRVGVFGASTGAAAALVAAARDGPPSRVRAVVSRGGRPDLAGPWLGMVDAPTLLIVGGEDVEVLALNRRAMSRMRCEVRLEVVPGATHLFEEPGTLERASGAAREWFARHLGTEGGA